MGKASKKRNNKEEDQLSKDSRKILKQMIRESKPEPFVVDGKVVYYNPLKKLLKSEKYSADSGKEVTKEMVRKYEQFLKSRMKSEKIAKKNNVDIEEVE